jgi:hypothetical protein
MWVYIDIRLYFQGGFVMNIIISKEAKERLSMMGKKTMTIYTEAVGSC